MPVYAAPLKRAGVIYPGFRADLRSFNLNRPFGSSLDALEAKVRELVGPFVGEYESLILRRGPLRVYERASTVAKEMGLELDEAMLQLRTIQRLAAMKRCSPEQALDYWGRHHDHSKYSTATRQVVDVFVDELKRRGNSVEDIGPLRSILNRFAKSFSCPLTEITMQQYRQYFAGLKVQPRTLKNHRAGIRRLIRWAKGNGYLAPDHPGCPDFVSKVQVPPKEVEVFDINQREQLLKQTTEVERPMVLIKAYVPIRQKEVGLSRWENIDWEMGIMHLPAKHAKKRRPRVLHFPRELCERLRPLAQAAGKIYPFKSFYRVGPRLARKAGLEWILNGWRTTTISHLQAAINDKHLVAQEAGTSVDKMETNYLKLMRPDVGRAYFGLRKGEFHPIEPGYNAAHYGSEPPTTGAASGGGDNVISVVFSARQP